MLIYNLLSILECDSFCSKCYLNKENQNIECTECSDDKKHNIGDNFKSEKIIWNVRIKED